MDSRLHYPEALKLRLAGKTYGEIRKIVDVPKSTLSVWFKRLTLSPRASALLTRKKRKGLQALQISNKKRTEKIREENEHIRKIHQNFIGRITDRELMLLGAALYWGEGYKNFKENSYIHLAFANSDPCMIRLFIKFMERILKISRGRMKCQIMLHQNAHGPQSITYWHFHTGIPRSNFRIQYLISRASQGIRPRNLLPHGTLQIRVNNRREFFKIRGLIDGISR